MPRRFERSPLWFLNVALVVTFVALSWVVWSIYSVGFREASKQNALALEVEELGGKIIYLDEVLTMSARMAAETGDSSWEQRYRRYEPQLGAAIERAIKLVPGLRDTEGATVTDAANIALVEMEEHAFDLIRQGRSGRAHELLYSPHYEEQKQIYVGGMQQFHQTMHETIELAGDNRRQAIRAQIIVVSGIALIVGLGWIMVYQLLVRWKDKQEHSRIEAEQANRAKSEFLTSMSHELRTPLNAILGFAQILQSDTENPLSTDQTAYVGHIHDGGKHLLGLINQVLDLARIDSDQFDVSLENVNVDEVLAECIALISPLGEARQIRLVNKLNFESSPLLHVDKLRLKQILINLLSNAVKYNKDAGTVSIQGRETRNGYLRLSVTDTGVGIANSDRKNVFQMFHRLSSGPETVEGTGIGLSVTKLLVEKLAGRIGFESQEGVGSTFWIELPLATNKEVLIWNDTLRVGVDAIDTDHRTIISLYNKVSRATLNETDVDDVLGELINYTRFHFGREEAIMEVCGYPDLEAHQTEHNRLMGRANDLANIWRAKQDPETLRQLREFLRDWLVGHIEKVDTGIADYARDKTLEIQNALEGIEPMDTLRFAATTR